MGFISALHQIRINKKDFKQWEQENQDKDKQREVLAKNMPSSEAQLRKAQQQGEVIMDVIDIMDTHSEEVAENAETVIMPLAALFPLAAFLPSISLGSIYLQKLGKKSAEALEAFKKSDDGNKLNEIFDRLTELQKNAAQNTNLKKMSDIERLNLSKPTALLNKKNLEILQNSKDKTLYDISSQVKEIQEVYKNIPAVKELKKKTPLVILSIIGITAAAYIYSNIKATKLQVQSSRIARWQSRKDISNPKYFVQYTPEQIEEAKKRVNEQDSEKKENFFDKLKQRRPRGSSGILELKKVISDNKNYKEWKSGYNQEDKKIKRQLTPEELEQAKRDQEVIHRITKTINNRAEEYSENMETAGGVIIGSTPFIGLVIGAIVNKCFTITGLGNKISKFAEKKFINNIEPQYRDTAKKTMDNIKNFSGSNFISSFKGIAESAEGIMDIIEKSVKSNKTGSDLYNALSSAKTVAYGVLSTNKGRAAVIALTGGFITGFVGSLLGLKLQKNSARAGRYVAKHEIENNPNSFIGYTDKEFDTVKEIKSEPKTIGQKFKNYITFLPRVIKEYFEYEKYNETQAKYDRKLKDELVKTDVSEKQLEEAKDIQRKLFTTFENVDDKSQEYSESVEAVTEMVQPFLPYLGYLMFILPIVAGGAVVAKKGPVSVAEAVTGFFAKHTNILKGKKSEKYFNTVAENISNIIQKTEKTDSAHNLSGISDILSKFISNEEVISSEFDKYGNVKLSDLMKKFGSMEDLKQIKLPEEEVDAILKMFDELLQNQELAGQIPADKIRTFIANNKNVSLYDLFINFEKSFGGIYEDLNINTILEQLKKSFPTEKFSEYKDQTLPVLDGIIKGQIKSGNIINLLEKNSDKLPDSLRATIRKILNSGITNEQALTIYENLTKIVQNLSGKEISTIFNALKTEFAKDPEKFAAALSSGKLKEAFLTNGIITLTTVTTGTWAAISVLATFAIESMFASLQKQAGRLGVMKAIQDLEDPSYYANANAAIASASETNTPNNKALPKTSPMLQELILKQKQNTL